MDHPSEKWTESLLESLFRSALLYFVSACHMLQRSRSSQWCSVTPHGKTLRQEIFFHCRITPLYTLIPPKHSMILGQFPRIAEPNSADPKSTLPLGLIQARKVYSVADKYLFHTSSHCTCGHLIAWLWYFVNCLLYCIVIGRRPPGF